MAETTGISWCDHTFNPWQGCFKVSDGCKHCYAESLSKRYGKDLWGPAATTHRQMMSESYWKQPLAWDRKAERDGVRRRVFCASMADVFEDHPEVSAARACLWALIQGTPHLDWLLLTKRPENIPSMVRPHWMHAGFPANIWIGTSVEHEEAADERIPHLLRIPARVRFLSCEPLLGPVDVSHWLAYGPEKAEWFLAHYGSSQPLSWVIVGGESGPHFRPMDLEWARDIRDACDAAGVPFFYKQGSGYRSGMNPELDGQQHHEWPTSQEGN